MKHEAFDYEGVFPIRRRREDHSELEKWPSSVKSKKVEVDTVAAQPLNARSQGTVPLATTSSSRFLSPQSHRITFVCLFIFSVVLYVRPYEAIPALSSFKSMAYFTGLATLAVFVCTQLATEGNLTARPKEINLVLLLGLAALLSMPMADDKARAWTTFTDMLLKTILIFIVFVNVVRTELRLKMLLLLVLAVSVYLSVNAINDYRMGFFQVGEMETQRIAGRIKGLFENSNDLALHLVTMIPIAAALGIIGRNPLKKLVYFGILGLLIGGVTVTFSRGGFIGLLAATFVLVQRLGKKNRVLTIAALVFAVILFLGLAPGAFSSRLSTIFNSAADVTGSSTQRTEVLKRSFWVMLRFPIFGVGIGNFVLKSPRNLETHNAYTQVGAELGVGAMVVYIMFLVHSIRRLRLVENETDTSPDQRTLHYLSIGLQASLVGFMFASFFGAVAYQWYVYYLVGYSVCLHRIYIMKFRSHDESSKAWWEHPFAKKKNEGAIPDQPATQPSHV